MSRPADLGALRALESWPRTPLAHLPTPLVQGDRLASALGLAPGALVLKLDDYTGFALGGNKVRKLETELAPHRLRGIDTLITCGGAQSNHARVTAAAAAHLGLRCILVINGQPEKSPTGNARLHQLLTPHIRWIPSREDRGAALEQAQADVEAEGSTPLVVPIGASTGRGALGYALAMKEIEIQSSSLTGWEPARTWLFVATSSGGTLAGVLLGTSILGWEGLRIVGVSADDPPDAIRERVLQQAREGARLIGYEGTLLSDQVTITSAFVGAGYGIPTDESLAAGKLWARTEGVVLDPTYTSKAAAGVMEWTKSGRIRRGDRIVFWHTGGAPALLA